MSLLKKMLPKQMFGSSRFRMGDTEAIAQICKAYEETVATGKPIL